VTIFKSQQVNLDPEPWIHPDSYNRYAEASPEDFLRSPRPEFEPTRDPHPYASALGARYAYPGTLGSERLVWAPRREQFDTPVNPLLAEFRLLWAGQTDMQDMAAEMVYNLTDHDYLWEMQRDTDYTPDQVNHAVKVLERLAAF